MIIGFTKRPVNQSIIIIFKIIKTKIKEKLFTFLHILYLKDLKIKSAISLQL